MCCRFIGDSGDVRPGDDCAVTAKSDAVMRWGFTAYDRFVFNIRSDTASIKFFDEFVNGRCAVKAHGYYEWSEQKQKFVFIADGDVFLAALCRTVHEPQKPVQLSFLGNAEQPAPKRRFAVLTESATGDAAKIHTRMPVLLSAACARDFIDGADLSALPRLKVTGRQC